ncbi:MAG: hypothetical protein PHT12_01905 [Patescibacteria group bacterium]|nr:hypothetical protein [Patescibacteria group bacterium]
MFRRDGFALLSAAVLMGVILATGVVMLNYAFSSRQAAKTFESEVFATQTAEAGIYKALFCMNTSSGGNCGGQYGENYAGESDIAIGNGKVTTTVTTNGTEKTVTAVGYTGAGKQETVKVTVSASPPTADAAFDYALEVGDGGVFISNNAEVRSGPIYSHSSINCGNNAKLDGPVYVSAANGLVDNCTLYGDIHADRITNNKMNSHDVYWKTTSSGNNNVGHSYSSQNTPPQQGLPSVDLPFWHAAAEAGGTIAGDYTAPTGSHLGPKVITGNLTLTNNAIVTLDGPVWVQGTITLSNNAQLNLNPSYGVNSTVVMADGVISISNNAQINGSGHLKSFILVHSSSDNTDAAIDISNNAAGAIFYAPYGGISISNNATVTAVAARKVSLSNNCIIDYSTTYHDASDIRLAATPSGDWRFVPNGWRSIP